MGLVSWHKSSWEEPTISRVVSDVNRAGYKVVVVDDGSSDGTADHAGAAGARLIVHPFNLGQGAALQTRIDYALAQIGRVRRHLRCRRPASSVGYRTPRRRPHPRAGRLRARQLGKQPTYPLRRLMLQAAT